VKVLITGNRGFLGRHFHAALGQQHDVTGFDLHPAGDELAIDVRDWARWDDTSYDLVLHCAAVAPHRAAIDAAPLTMGAGNLALDAAVFNWATRTRPGRLVYFSSCAAYPDRPLTAGRMHEDDVTAAQFSVHQPDMYGWVKLTGERLARHYAQHGGEVTIVRPFSGYGSDQDTRFPFGAFLDRARRRVDPFEIWGDGTQVRDWIHVDDIVGAVMALVIAGVTGPVNIGTGRPTTFNELAWFITEQAGYSPRVEHRLDAPAGARYRVADPARLLEHYWPTVTLEEGIRRALAA
jgi:nucleoside-diphosphate-sugar epimerase